MNVTDNIPAGDATVGSVLLGATIAIFTVPGLISNVVVLTAIGTSDLLRHPEKTIYRAVFTLLVCDTLQLCNIMGIGLAGAAQDILVPQSWYRVPGFLFLWMWQEAWFLLSFIAINRYVMACHPGRFGWLSRGKSVSWMMGLSWVASLCTMLVSQVFLPCCRFVVLPLVFTLSWMKGDDEKLWADWLVEWPGNSATTLIICLSYIGILNVVRQTNRQVADSLERSQQIARKKQELKFAFQFMIISTLFILCTIIFRVFPIIVPEGYVKPFATLTFCLILNCSINSWVYVAFNQEVKSQIGRLLGAQMEESQAWTKSDKHKSVVTKTVHVHPV